MFQVQKFGSLFKIERTLQKEMLRIFDTFTSTQRRVGNIFQLINRYLRNCSLVEDEYARFGIVYRQCKMFWDRGSVLLSRFSTESLFQFLMVDRRNELAYSDVLACTDCRLLQLLRL